MSDSISYKFKVGPVLETGTLADTITDVIQRTHSDVEVIHRGSYVRILVPHQCLIKRSEIEKRMGIEIRFPNDLEKIMPSFKGKFKLTEDEAIWFANES